MNAPSTVASSVCPMSCKTGSVFFDCCCYFLLTCAPNLTPVISYCQAILLSVILSDGDAYGLNSG